MQVYIGTVLLVPYNFVPLGWLACDGSSYPISQYEALFALIGTTYGGDGVTTFNVPDLRGRVPIGMGQGSGLSNYVIGQNGGSETITLTTQQLPAHTHAGSGLSVDGNNVHVANALFGSGQTVFQASPPAAANAPMNPQSSSLTGGSQPHENRAPYQAIQWVIAPDGIFPTQG